MIDDFQIVINTSLLREFPKSKFLLCYAKFYYLTDEDISSEGKIQENIVDLLDWDKHGDSGLEIFCSRFESIKRRDLKMLVQYVLDNVNEIKRLSKKYIELRALENQKVIRTNEEILEEKMKKHFCAEDYEVNPYGKPAKKTIYKGRVYKSRQECMYKEGITKAQLYKYLKKNEKF